jgi:ABC-2 type transport system ATP-binding protein
MSMSAVIDCHKLSKRYGRSTAYALKDLTLQVQSGEVYGFLGPNGAGKSTTIRTLLNFIQPTSGSAQLLGHDIVRDSVQIKASVGYLAGDAAMYRKLTGRQFLDYMHELQPAVSKAYRQELAKRLKADLDKPLGALSRGNRQKIGIIQAFMHQPQLLILDEPSSGLDPLMQEVFYDLVHEAKQRGATIFASSHILSEIQKICDRVGIIRDGRLIAERNIADMANEAAQTFDVMFKDRPPLAALQKIPGVQITSNHGGLVTLHINGPLAPLLKELARHDVIKLDTRTLDLEEVFLRFYDDQEMVS